MNMAGEIKKIQNAKFTHHKNTEFTSRKKIKILYIDTENKAKYYKKIYLKHKNGS